MDMAHGLDVLTSVDYKRYIIRPRVFDEVFNVFVSEEVRVKPSDICFGLKQPGGHFSRLQRSQFLLRTASSIVVETRSIALPDVRETRC